MLSTSGPPRSQTWEILSYWLFQPDLVFNSSVSFVAGQVVPFLTASSILHFSLSAHVFSSLPFFLRERSARPISLFFLQAPFLPPLDRDFRMPALQSAMRIAVPPPRLPRPRVPSPLDWPLMLGLLSAQRARDAFHFSGSRNVRTPLCLRNKRVIDAVSRSRLAPSRPNWRS